MMATLRSLEPDDCSSVVFSSSSVWFVIGTEKSLSGVIVGRWNAGSDRMSFCPQGQPVNCAGFRIITPVIDYLGVNTLALHHISDDAVIAPRALRHNADGLLDLWVTVAVNRSRRQRVFASFGR
jgi:hypothetical protein